MNQHFEYVPEISSNEQTSNPLQEEALDLLAGPNESNTQANQSDVESYTPKYSDQTARMGVVLYGSSSITERLDRNEKPDQDVSDQDLSLGKVLIEFDVDAETKMEALDKAIHDQCKNSLLKKVFHYGKDVTGLGVGGGLAGSAVGAGPWGTAIGAGVGALSGAVKASNKLKSDYLECSNNYYGVALESASSYLKQKEGRR